MKARTEWNPTPESRHRTGEANCGMRPHFQKSQKNQRKQGSPSWTTYGLDEETNLRPGKWSITSTATSTQNPVNNGVKNVAQVELHPENENSE